MSSTHTDFPSGGGGTDVFSGPLIPGFSPSGEYKGMVLDFDDPIWNGSPFSWGTYANLSGTGAFTRTDGSLGGDVKFPLYQGASPSLDYDSGKSIAFAFTAALVQGGGIGNYFGIGFDTVAGLDTQFVINEKINSTTDTANRLLIGKAENDDDLYLYINFGAGASLTSLLTMTGANTRTKFNVIVIADATTGDVTATVNGVSTVVAGAYAPSVSTGVRLNFDPAAGGIQEVSAPIFNYEL